MIDGELHRQKVMDGGRGKVMVYFLTLLRKITVTDIIFNYIYKIEMLCVSINILIKESINHLSKYEL